MDNENTIEKMLDRYLLDEGVELTNRQRVKVIINLENIVFDSLSDVVDGVIEGRL